ncbi:MAG: sulfurtransferase complex subunit TusB [Thermoplasmata archaeon]|nr:sulfurtransferase complex subunit TusB [Thermoplasmata archaeon]
MKTAYIVLKSPQEQNPSHLIGRFSGRDESTAILVEDGVYQAMHMDASRRLKDAASTILVSREDLLARGFTERDLKAGKATDYGEIVESIMEHTERTITL